MSRAAWRGWALRVALPMALAALSLGSAQGQGQGLVSTPTATPTQAAAPAPAGAAASTPAAPACAVLLGGGGANLPDADDRDRWFAINHRVSRAVAEALVRDGYRVFELIVQGADPDARARSVMQETTRRGCSWVLEIAVSFANDATRTPPGPSFAFDVKLLRLQRASDSTRVSVVGGDFRRSYRYPWTEASMRALSVQDIAQRIVAEVEAAPATQPLH